MEQLDEMNVNCISVPECPKVEVCVEPKEINCEPEREKKANKVPIEKGLSKLFKKSKYNAKYMEQIIPIQRLEHERVHRNYGIW